MQGRRAVTARQADFESASGSRSWEVSAVLTQETKERGKKLCLSSASGFRVGLRVSVNPGGATEELHVVQGFLPSAVVIQGTLRHDHFHGERVCMFARALQDGVVSSHAQHSEDAALHSSSVVLEFDDQPLAFSPESEVIDDDMESYDAAVDFPYFAASLGFTQKTKGPSVEDSADPGPGAALDAPVFTSEDVGVPLGVNGDEMRAPASQNVQPSRGAPGRKGVHTQIRVLGGVVLSLVWYLRPPWISYDVAKRRTERYGLLLTATFVAAFFQCLLFMLGDGCEHQPQPAICQRAVSMIDWSKLFQSAWGLTFALPVTVSASRLFKKRPVHGVRTQTERRQRLMWWRRRERYGWLLLLLAHLFLLSFFVSFVNFYPTNLVWTWVRGCTLSTLVTTTASPVARAVNVFMTRQFIVFARGECF